MKKPPNTRAPQHRRRRASATTRAATTGLSADDWNCIRMCCNLPLTGLPCTTLPERVALHHPALERALVEAAVALGEARCHLPGIVRLIQRARRHYPLTVHGTLCVSTQEVCYG